MAPMKVVKKSSARASVPPVLLLRVANERSDVFEVLDDFNMKNKAIQRQTDSGMKISVSCYTWQTLTDELKEFVITLTENNMKELYEKVNENSSAKEIQEVCSEIDAFLSINFKTTINAFAEGKKTTMEKDKELTDEEITAIGEAFPYPEYPKKVLE